MSILNREFGKRSAGSSGKSPQDQKLDDLRELAIWLARTQGLRTKSRLGGLPSHGMLFFFADIEEEMLWGFEDRGDQCAATRVNLPRRRGPSASLRRICPR